MKALARLWRRSQLVRVALLLALGWAAAPATWAQACYNSGNLDMSFGTVNLGGTANTMDDASYSCQSNANTTYFRLCLYVAEGPGGGNDMSGVNPRKMTNYGGGTIGYTLYSNAARTQVLGPEGGAFTVYTTNLTVPANHAKTSLNMTVYGRVGPVAMGTAAGSYQAQFDGVRLRYAWSNTETPASCVQSPGGVASTYFEAKANVSNSCAVSVSATDLAFGSASSLANAIAGTSTITLSCPPNVIWRMGLNNGLNAVGTQRRMAGPGGDRVQYELYRDAGRTQRWGNDTTGGTDTVNGPLSGQSNPAQLTVYGRVPAGQASVTPGSYSDTITVTLTY